MMVSICVITYNQEQFIRETIDGIFNQEVNFDYEVIISSDCSPDNTGTVVHEYIQHHQHGGLIKYFCHDENIGMMPNFIFALQKCQGKYIAICEGDDYWTDKNKLQKQIDFMEANPDFAICFHRAKIVYNEGIEPFYPDLNLKMAGTTTLNDLSRGNYIHTATVVLRNVISGGLPGWFYTAYPGDWPLFIITACSGKIKFFPEEMAAYRVHTGGVHSTTGKNRRSLKYLATIKNLAAYVKGSHPEAYRTLLRTHKIAYFESVAIKDENELNRLERMLVFLKTGWYIGSIKMLLFFWLPVVFGKNTERAWRKLSVKEFIVRIKYNLH